MPKMVQVISDVQADITSHAGTTGAQVLSRVAHKRHQVKQAIGRLYASSTITPTPVNTTLRFNTKFSDENKVLTTGSVYATKLDLVSNFSGNITITHVYVNVVNAIGNIRVKIYDGTPNVLLGESNSTVATTGLMTIPLISNVVIAPSNSVWIGIENDNGLLSIKASTDSTNKKITHVFGAGPNPFGSATTSNVLPYVGVKATQNQIPRWDLAQWT